MSAPVTYDQVLAGIVAELQPLVPAQGQPLTPTQYLRKLESVTGGMGKVAEVLKRVAGNTPAALVGFVSERSISTTIGRRVDKVESTFNVWCASDSKRGLNDRRQVYPLANDVRRLLGARKLGLPISGLRYRSFRVAVDDERAYVVVLAFSTQYRVDYTKQADYDVLDEASGPLTTAAGTEVVSVERDYPEA